MQVGLVVVPHGVRGEVKVQATTDSPDRFARLKSVHVGPDRRPMEVAGARTQGDRVILRLAAVADRDAAEALRGQGLYVRRSEVPPLPEGRYYHDQIIGLRVLTTGGEPLGTVREILETGNNDVYVTSDGSREVLIPAIREVVRRIDLEAGELVVDPIEGLL